MIRNDDEELRVLVLERPVGPERVAPFLDELGLAPVLADDATSISRVLRAGEVGVVVIDLDLIHPSGLDLCRHVREQSDLPIVVVSTSNGEGDVVAALELGADDFVPKPLRPRELMARLRAARRRAGRASGDRGVARLRVGGLEIDRRRHEVRLDGNELHLSPKEFGVLELLVSRAGDVVSRRDLIEEIWGGNYHGDTKTLDTHVRRLRAKLEDDPTEPRRLVTVRGLGYRFEPDPPAPLRSAPAPASVAG